MRTRKGIHKEPMAPTLDDLLNDGRLARLFSTDGRHCALQLWILQIKSGQAVENRVVYGRLLPYSYSSDCWFSTADDNFKPFGDVQAQIVRLSLYVKSTCCAELLRQLSAGQSISAISKELKLELSDQLNNRFGSTALTPDHLIYRPVAYLLNRDAYDRCSASSPHGGAGALSASIIQADKEKLFRLGQGYDVALTASVVKHLNADTGLNFGGVDTARFGDLELLIFPALDDLERPLLDVSWADPPPTLIAKFNPIQVPHFGGFQYRLSIANDCQIVYSIITTAERNAEGVFEGKFELSDHLRAITDSTELEIFGCQGDHTGEGMLVFRWRVTYIREIGLDGRVAGRRGSPVEFDWLKRTIRPSASDRAKAVLTTNSGTKGFTNRIGAREADPWVPPNRDLGALFSRLHPTASQGRFFERWSQGDGEGRLQFVEWFKALLARYREHQIVIFDPYFDAAGLGLLSLCAVRGADYIVFRSMPKPVKEGTPQRRKVDSRAQEGINNLIANCEQRSYLLQRIKLRIYGLKAGKLHDRYILIKGPDGLPVAGFNLSNSFQKAAENYPLLVTPIPADTLLKVEDYKAGLLGKVANAWTGGEADNAFTPLFDSTASPTVPRRYESLRCLDKAQAGDVLSVWAGEPLLRGLSGDQLKEQMKELNLLKNDSLALPDTAGLRRCLDQQAGGFAEFTPTWEVLGELLAHSNTQDSYYHGIESRRDFLDFLARFLKTSFNRAYDGMERELALPDPQLFLDSVETLLHSPYQLQQLFHATKYVALTWSEYFAIRFLWRYAPEVLLAIAEVQMANVPTEPQGQDVLGLSLLSQIVSEISLSVQFDISVEQRDLLVGSGSGLLQWLGLNAIAARLEKPDGVATVSQLVGAFSYREQVRALGWMVHRVARTAAKAETYKGVVAALHEVLPATIPADDLRLLIDSMRGHMRLLPWTEPWLFQDVVFPLLGDGRANYDDACEIWVQELAALLTPEPDDDEPQFDISREGRTTNIAAFLFANSTPKRQQISLKSMQAILKLQTRVVQQPLASTSDWSRWNRALVVSMWLLTFAKWCQYYLRGRGITDPALEKLASDASKIAMVRAIDEWRAPGVGRWGELTALLDQVEERLASSD